MTQINYKRILLKLSGESLLGSQAYGIDPAVIERIAKEVGQVLELGIEIGLVVGAGNIFRGKGLAEAGIDRATGDQMGMLATVINGMAIQDGLEKAGLNVRVMSALSVNDVCEDYIRRRAIRHLEKGRVVVMVAGTGSPFFTTDTAASLRAIEIGAGIVLKATNVDGVYDSDPAHNADAVRYDRLGYDEVIAKKLGVMDATAIVLCRDQNMPIQVFDVNQPDSLLKVVQGETIGTIVS
ncbi:MAG: UMP kinase [bacterium]